MGQKITTPGSASCGSCLVALFGLCLLPLFPIGTIFGVGLIYIGNGMGSKILCSKCQNPVGEESKMCPACKEPLG